MTRRWRFRIPREDDAQTTTARQYLQRVWPEGTSDQVDVLFSKACVEVDDVVVTRPDRPLEPDAVVVAESEDEGTETFGLPEAEALLWHDKWVIVDKPVGIPGRLTEDDPMDPIRFMADMLGVDREGFTPAWEMPATAGGPWLIGRDPETSEELAKEIFSDHIKTTWVAIAPRPDRGQGSFKTDFGTLQFAVTRTEGGLAELQLWPKWSSPQQCGDRIFFQLLEMMAQAGFPVLGDGLHGGYLVAGGLRLRLGAVYGTDEFAHSWPAPRDWWPDEPVTPPVIEEEPPEEQKEHRKIDKLQVSQKTLEIVEGQGHPWILRDRHTGSTEGMDPGDPVQLVGPGAPSKTYALVDGTGSITARVWSHSREEATDIDGELEIRLDEAIGKRRELFRQMGNTDIFRVVHAEADGMPGLFIDRIGPLWRVITTARCARSFRERIYDLLRRRDDSAMILELEHLQDLRRRDELPRARIIEQGAEFLADGDNLVVHEEGLRFRVEPWEGIDVGFFADQRDNRRDAVDRAESGQRWLNLFCHTGAFSVALANFDVYTTNIDLSRRYLKWLDANFELNDLSLDLRTNHAVDARTFLADTTEKYQGIIVDPPTAAAGDQGFWSVRDDYKKLLADCFEVLDEGGSMLVCRNDKKARDSLKKLVRSAAKDAGRQIHEIKDAPPSADYPVLPGFPEGTKFEGLWVR